MAMETAFVSCRDHDTSKVGSCPLGSSYLSCLWFLGEPREELKRAQVAGCTIENSNLQCYTHLSLVGFLSWA